MDRLFSEYDNEVELESDNANQNQNSTTSNFFVASDQEFMQQFRDQIANELFQVFNNLSFLVFYHRKKCNV